MAEWLQAKQPSNLPVRRSIMLPSVKMELCVFSTQPVLSYHRVTIVFRQLERFDLEKILALIAQKKYFVLHAPRQTGKTSSLLALQDKLNAGEQYRVVYVNVEVGQSAREDVAAAMRAILEQLALEAESVNDDQFVSETWTDVFNRSGAHGALMSVLRLWASNDTKPLVVIFDECAETVASNDRW